MLFLVLGLCVCFSIRQRHITILTSFISPCSEVVFRIDPCHVTVVMLHLQWKNTLQPSPLCYSSHRQAPSPPILLMSSLVQGFSYICITAIFLLSFQSSPFTPASHLLSNFSTLALLLLCYLR